jgi:hypothetical protein
MRYVTMTPSGSTGNSYEAPGGTAGAEQAAQLATMGTRCWTSWAKCW